MLMIILFGYSIIVFFIGIIGVELVNIMCEEFGIGFVFVVLL